MVSVRRIASARRTTTVVKWCLLVTFIYGVIKLWDQCVQDGQMVSSRSKRTLVRAVVNNISITGSQTHYEPATSMHESEIRRKDGGTCKFKTRVTTFSSCPECFRPNIPFVNRVIGKVDTNASKFSYSSKYEYLFKPREKIQQNLVTKYLIMPSSKFLDDCPYLLAVQASVSDSRTGRDAIRNTWASVAKEQQWPFRRINAEVKVIFVLAHKQSKNITKDNSNSSEVLWKEVQEEAMEHDDILYLDMMDSYRNLTLKLLSAFKWVTDYCPCVKFVLKVDQDTFVNVPFLVDTLLYFEKRLELSILGHSFGGPNPAHRWGKWGTAKELYPLNKYPPYASGCGYIIPSRVLSKIVEIAPYIPMFSIEDAFITGVLRLAVGSELLTVERHMFADFHEPGWKNCLMYRDEKFMGTKVFSAKHGHIWHLFLNGGPGCHWNTSAFD